MSQAPSIPSRLLEDVRAILRDARGKAYVAVNAAMVDAYWRIGRRIVEEEQGGSVRAEYGSQLIRHLARSARSSVKACPSPISGISGNFT